MKRLRFAILTTLYLTASIATASAQNAPAPVPATPENAAAFLGNWTVETTGSYGPVTLEVTLKVAEGKVAGEVTSANTGKVAITSISKAGPSLLFVYVFDYNGMPITSNVTLTPPADKDKKVEAYIDMANGAAQFSGTATKK